MNNGITKNKIVVGYVGIGGLQCHPAHVYCKSHELNIDECVLTDNKNYQKDINGLNLDNYVIYYAPPMV